jgi:hypothetical protein
VQQRVAADNRIQETPALPPLHAASPSPGTQPEIAVPLTRFDAYLGLDVGSVSTNLVLLTPDCRVARSIYLPTRGRPVEVLHQGLSQLRAEFGHRVHILGVGATGSGRHLAAKAVGADVTHNEITAQMASSLLYFPEVDTIFEIGGQDSKCIAVRNGCLDSVGRALVRARMTQDRFVEARNRMGREALATPFDRAAVVLGRPSNTHDAFLNLSLAQHLERLDLPAIPWDLLPLGEVQLDPRWQNVPWHYNREQLRALELIRQDRRLFPILISNYGCGPDGFTIKHLEELLDGTPRLLLEFDEHRGEASLVTRLEAFADEIEEYLRSRGPALPSPVLTPGPRARPSGRHFFIPHFSEHAEMYAAALRSAGYTAEVLPAPELIRLARPYLGRRTHFLIVLTVAKIADFLHRGAAGVISAAGINCVVRTVTASLAPAIRAGYGDAPVLSLVYGSSEGPGQRIRLETFVHQVQERWRRRAAA